MKTKLMTLTASLMAMVAVLTPQFSLASELAPQMKTNSKNFYFDETEYSSMMRVTVVGGIVTSPSLGSNSSNASSGGGGSLLADVGSGRWSVEFGAQFIAMPTIVKTTNANFVAPNGAAQSQILNTVDTQYVGVPLLVKFNYIENPHASFSLKAGVMPATMVGAKQQTTFYDPNTGGQTDLQLPQSDIFAVAGFTGTAPLAGAFSFVVDGSYFYGTNPIDAYGSHNQAFLIAAGLRMAL